MMIHFPVVTLVWCERQCDSWSPCDWIYACTLILTWGEIGYFFLAHIGSFFAHKDARIRKSYAHTRTTHTAMSHSMQEVKEGRVSLKSCSYTMHVRDIKSRYTGTYGKVVLRVEKSPLTWDEIEITAFRSDRQGWPEQTFQYCAALVIRKSYSCKRMIRTGQLYTLSSLYCIQLNLSLGGGQNCWPQQLSAKWKARGRRKKKNFFALISPYHDSRNKAGYYRGSLQHSSKCWGGVFQSWVTAQSSLKVGVDKAVGRSSWLAQEEK